MENNQQIFVNPFRPGAAQRPPYLAGREKEKDVFKKLLGQKPVLKNLVLKGLRGTGKTVLLDEFKPIALNSGWLWAGTELSESASVSELTIAIRILTDLSILTSNLLTLKKDGVGFASEMKESRLDYNSLENHFKSRPGLVADKLKATIEYILGGLETISQVKGIVFAYDEAQEMNDQEKKEQFPLGVLLDVFQSLQKQGKPVILILAGLPPLHPKLIETRGYAERMFEVLQLESITKEETIKAISIPIENKSSPVRFDRSSMELIAEKSGGYPYFIQFICKESFDSFIAQMKQGITNPSVPLTEIVAKLDEEFFAPKWSLATDRERDLLGVIANIPNCENEFTIKEILEEQKKENLEKPMSHSQISQMLVSLSHDGLIFRTIRHGKYTLGVPMLGEYLRRQTK